jgi:hypothetical protein
VLILNLEWCSFLDSSFFLGLFLGKNVVYMYVSTCSTIVLNFAIYIIYRHFLCMSSRVDNFE